MHRNPHSPPRIIPSFGLPPPHPILPLGGLNHGSRYLNNHLSNSQFISNFPSRPTPELNSKYRSKRALRLSKHFSHAEVLSYRNREKDSVVVNAGFTFKMDDKKPELKGGFKTASSKLDIKGGFKTPPVNSASANLTKQVDKFLMKGYRLTPRGGNYSSSSLNRCSSPFSSRCSSPVSCSLSNTSLVSESSILHRNTVTEPALAAPLETRDTTAVKQPLRSFSNHAIPYTQSERSRKLLSEIVESPKVKRKEKDATQVAASSTKPLLKSIKGLRDSKSVSSSSLTDTDSDNTDKSSGSAAKNAVINGNILNVSAKNAVTNVNNTINAVSSGSTSNFAAKNAVSNGNIVNIPAKNKISNGSTGLINHQSDDTEDDFNKLEDLESSSSTEHSDKKSNIDLKILKRKRFAASKNSYSTSTESLKSSGLSKASSIPKFSSKIKSCVPSIPKFPSFNLEPLNHNPSSPKIGTKSSTFGSKPAALVRKSSFNNSNKCMKVTSSEKKSPTVQKKDMGISQSTDSTRTAAGEQVSSMGQKTVVSTNTMKNSPNILKKSFSSTKKLENSSEKVKSTSNGIVKHSCIFNNNNNSAQMSPKVVERKTSFSKNDKKSFKNIKTISESVTLKTQKSSIDTKNCDANTDSSLSLSESSEFSTASENNSGSDKNKIKLSLKKISADIKFVKKRSADGILSEKLAKCTEILNKNILIEPEKHCNGTIKEPRFERKNSQSKIKQFSQKNAKYLEEDTKSKKSKNVNLRKEPETISKEDLLSPAVKPIQSIAPEHIQAKKETRVDNQLNHDVNSGKIVEPEVEIYSNNESTTQKVMADITKVSNKTDKLITATTKNLGVLLKMTEEKLDRKEETTKFDKATLIDAEINITQINRKLQKNDNEKIQMNDKEHKGNDKIAGKDKEYEKTKKEKLENTICKAKHQKNIMEKEQVIEPTDNHGIETSVNEKTNKCIVKETEIAEQELQNLELTAQKEKPVIKPEKQEAATIHEEQNCVEKHDNGIKKSSKVAEQKKGSKDELSKVKRNEQESEVEVTKKLQPSNKTEIKKLSTEKEAQAFNRQRENKSYVITSEKSTVNESSILSPNSSRRSSSSSSSGKSRVFSPRRSISGNLATIFNKFEAENTVNVGSKNEKKAVCSKSPGKINDIACKFGGSKSFNNLEKSNVNKGCERKIKTNVPNKARNIEGKEIKLVKKGLSKEDIDIAVDAKVKSIQNSNKGDEIHDICTENAVKTEGNKSNEKKELKSFVSKIKNSEILNKEFEGEKDKSKLPFDVTKSESKSVACTNESEQATHKSIENLKMDVLTDMKQSEEKLLQKDQISAMHLDNNEHLNRYSSPVPDEAFKSTSSSDLCNKLSNSNSAVKNLNEIFTCASGGVSENTSVSSSCTISNLISNDLTCDSLDSNEVKSPVVCIVANSCELESSKVGNIFRPDSLCTVNTISSKSSTVTKGEAVASAKWASTDPISNIKSELIVTDKGFTNDNNVSLATSNNTTDKSVISSSSIVKNDKVTWNTDCINSVQTEIGTTAADDSSQPVISDNNENKKLTETFSSTKVDVLCKDKSLGNNETDIVETSLNGPKDANIGQVSSKDGEHKKQAPSKKISNIAESIEDVHVSELHSHTSPCVVTATQTDSLNLSTKCYKNVGKALSQTNSNNIEINENPEASETVVTAVDELIQLNASSAENNIVTSITNPVSTYSTFQNLYSRLMDSLNFGSTSTVTVTASSVSNYVDCEPVPMSTKPFSYLDLLPISQTNYHLPTTNSSKLNISEVVSENVSTYSVAKEIQVPTSVNVSNTPKISTVSEDLPSSLNCGASSAIPICIESQLSTFKSSDISLSKSCPGASYFGIPTPPALPIPSNQAEAFEKNDRKCDIENRALCPFNLQRNEKIDDSDICVNSSNNTSSMAECLGSSFSLPYFPTSHGNTVKENCVVTNRNALHLDLYKPQILQLNTPKSPSSRILPGCNLNYLNKSFSASNIVSPKSRFLRSYSMQPSDPSTQETDEQAELRHLSQGARPKIKRKLRGVSVPKLAGLPAARIRELSLPKEVLNISQIIQDAEERLAKATNKPFPSLLKPSSPIPKTYSQETIPTLSPTSVQSTGTTEIDEDILTSEVQDIASPMTETFNTSTETTSELDISQLDILTPLPESGALDYNGYRSRSSTPYPDRNERSPTPRRIMEITEYSLSETDRILKKTKSLSSHRRSFSRSLSCLNLNRLSEASCELAEEQSASQLAGDRYESEQVERIRLQDKIEQLQDDLKRVSSANEFLEIEKLRLHSEILASVDDAEDNDPDSASLYRRKYEWAVREIESLRKQIKDIHNDHSDQVLLIKKQLEKKVADSSEEAEEQRQVVAQMKKKLQRVQGEANDLKIIIEEKSSRNNLLEKKQRKFDQDLHGVLEEVKNEKGSKEKAQRDRDQILAQKYSFEQEVSSLKMELELRDEKLATLSRELEELQTSGKIEDEVATLRKLRNDLNLKVKDQEEELDDLAGQVQMLEAAKIRLEMSFEQTRRENRKEQQQKDEELEELRVNSNKKIKALELQLENEHTSRAEIVREKHDLDRRLADAENRRFSSFDEEAATRTKRELKKTKALLRDTQMMLEKTQTDSSGKLVLRQLKAQLEDAEFAKIAAIRARQGAECDLNEMQTQLEDVLRHKKDAEDKLSRMAKERAEFQTQLEESEEETAELMKKYKSAVAQISADHANISEQTQLISDLEHQKQLLEEKLNEMSCKVEVLEGETANIHTQRRLEIRIKELESKLELEFTTRQRLENQISRLKDHCDRLNSDFEVLKSKEVSAQENCRKFTRNLREVKEESSTAQLKLVEANNRKRELEKQIEVADTEICTLKSDLKLAFKRIEDLQRALQSDDVSDDSNSDDTRDNDNDLGLMDFTN